MIPHKCPICEGSGKVEYNFYKDKSGLGLHEKCRTCKGSGVIWVEEKENPIPFNHYPLVKDDSANKGYDPCKNCPVRLNPNWNGICNCALPYIVNPRIVW